MVWSVTRAQWANVWGHIQFLTQCLSQGGNHGSECWVPSLSLLFKTGQRQFLMRLDYAIEVEHHYIAFEIDR